MEEYHCYQLRTTLPNITFSGQLHRPNGEHLVDLDLKDQQPIIYTALDTHWLKTAVLMTSRKPMILLWGKFGSLKWAEMKQTTNSGCGNFHLIRFPFGVVWR